MLTKNNKKIDKINFQKGYSLIELIIVIGVLSLILGIFGAFQADVFSLNRVIQVGINNQYEAKKIIRPFANEVRGAVQSEQGTYALAETTATTFTFYSNIDSAPDIERVRYFLDADTFKKGVIKPSGNPVTYNPVNEQITQVVKNVISDEIFTYYDSSYDGTASSSALTFPVNPAEVRLVKIVLTIDDDVSADPPPITVETQVSIRNLKSNR